MFKVLLQSRIHNRPKEFLNFSWNNEMKPTLMVRSGGRAQASELCLDARFLAERFPASRRTEPNLRARSMSSVWSESEAVESRSLSKETSMQREGDSVRLKSVPNSWSMFIWLRFGNLGFCEGQGRLAMDDGLWRRVSIAGGYQGEFVFLEVEIRTRGSLPRAPRRGCM